MIREVCKGFVKPILVDADALRPKVIEPMMLRSNWVVTPHLGELKRLADGQKCEDYEVSFPGVILRKGPHPKVLSGGKTFHLFSGSSVLSRGGSGDLLSGIIGSLLARGIVSVRMCRTRSSVAWSCV